MNRKRLMPIRHQMRNMVTAMSPRWWRRHLMMHKYRQGSTLRHLSWTKSRLMFLSLMREITAPASGWLKRTFDKGRQTRWSQYVILSTRRQITWRWNNKTTPLGHRGSSDRDMESSSSQSEDRKMPISKREVSELLCSKRILPISTTNGRGPVHPFKGHRWPLSSRRPTHSTLPSQKISTSRTTG